MTHDCTSSESASFQYSNEVSNADLLLSVLSGELSYTLDVHIHLACETFDLTVETDKDQYAPTCSDINLSYDWSKEIDNLFLLHADSPEEKTCTTRKKLNITYNFN